MGHDLEGVSDCHVSTGHVTPGSILKVDTPRSNGRQPIAELDTTVSRRGWLTSVSL